MGERNHIALIAWWWGWFSGVRVGNFENIAQAVKAPYIVEIKGVSLRAIGRWGWGVEGGRTHIIIAPEKIDTVVIINIG